MKNILLLLSIFVLISCETEIQKQDHKKDKPEYVLVIHGGAGYITKDRYNDQQEAEYINKLTEVLKKGDSLLKNGTPGLDVVVSVISMMEDCPLFNAGKGAVFTAAGENEMDASIMDGKTLNAGAVAGVKTIRNPIQAARYVMDSSKHVLLGGSGADFFASEKGLEIVDPSYFYTEKSWKNLQRALESKKKNEKHGTVGAVVLDKYGNLSAGTSTGGMTNKMFGRIGDSPIIGAGTYAENNVCAISGTGHGEYFIKNVVAYQIAALMKYRKTSLNEAADYVINSLLKSQNAGGGVIGVDQNGNITMTFNTQGMFRGYTNSNGEMEVKLYGSEKE